MKEEEKIMGQRQRQRKQKEKVHLLQIVMLVVCIIAFFFNVLLYYFDIDTTAATSTSSTDVGSTTRNNKDNSFLRPSHEGSEGATATRNLKKGSSTASDASDASSQYRRRTSYPETLWLVTCDDQGGGGGSSKNNGRNYRYGLEVPNIIEWMITAKAVQSNWHYYKQRQQKHQLLPDVQVRNICENIDGGWKGLMTKVYTVQSFVDDLLLTSGTDLVLFSDSDSFFNIRGMNILELIERYDVATHQCKYPILFSAESSCYVQDRSSDDCSTTNNYFSTKSNCPKYLNSGGYMGDVQSLKLMFDEMVGNDYDISKILQQKAMEQSKNRNDNSGMSDQPLFTVWHYHFQDKSILDFQSLVFRNMIFGLIDSNQPIQRQRQTTQEDNSSSSSSSCFPKDGCGIFRSPTQYTGIVNKSSLIIEFQDVPGCPSSSFSTDPSKFLSSSNDDSNSNNNSNPNNNNNIQYHYFESIPFNIHGAGPTRQAYRKLIGNYLDYYTQISKKQSIFFQVNSTTTTPNGNYNKSYYYKEYQDSIALRQEIKEQIELKKYIKQRQQ